MYDTQRFTSSSPPPSSSSSFFQTHYFPFSSGEKNRTSRAVPCHAMPYPCPKIPRPSYHSTTPSRRRRRRKKVKDGGGQINGEREGGKRKSKRKREKRTWRNKKTRYVYSVFPVFASPSQLSFSFVCLPSPAEVEYPRSFVRPFVCSCPRLSYPKKENTANDIPVIAFSSTA